MSDIRCDAQTILGQCWEVAAMKVQGGCRHEHIKIRDLCQWHGDDVLSDNSHGVCRECDEAGHDCSVIARLVTA